ncbi:TetR/AcrR family transcriptional regulator [Hamadaea tsunoensis]|uniref:TetR/AcrR family transcriptional regulator n=1 Tax=Hamadaea tsunoensis TaxID=53368 RepID=UPI00041014B8|nr:TetR/AcrR family transcriptional regulator [Hamadaea tsunoensis]
MATPDDSRERVLAAATRLFAERGYDGTTTREIGKASGLNIATVAYHVGSKAELYREVMRRAYTREMAALTDAVGELAAAGDLVAGARLLVGRYLDFCLANPEIPALWMRRWLADAAEVGEPEAEYAWPLAGLVLEAFSARGRDVQMALWTVTWSIHGFCRGGIIEPDGRRHGPGDQATVDRYRAHLDTLVTALLTETP